jgi:hypothetical protein
VYGGNYSLFSVAHLHFSVMLFLLLKFCSALYGCDHRNKRSVNNFNSWNSIFLSHVLPLMPDSRNRLVFMIISVVNPK